MDVPAREIQNVIIPGFIIKNTTIKKFAPFMNKLGLMHKFGFTLW